VPFDTESEAIAWANDSVYGLSASVWSKDAARCDRVARALETGNVSINNVMLTEGNHALPFGGTKQSGFGRYKGEFGLYSFANIKAILVDANGPKIEANWYPYTQEKLSLFARMMDGLFGNGLLRLIRFAISGLKLESLSNRLGG
jgi:delta 1-pyrroline-5-carboxylate dehydrogenase